MKLGRPGSGSLSFWMARAVIFPPSSRRHSAASCVNAALATPSSSEFWKFGLSIPITKPISLQRTAVSRTLARERLPADSGIDGILVTAIVGAAAAYAHQLWKYSKDAYHARVDEACELIF